MQGALTPVTGSRAVCSLVLCRGRCSVLQQHRSAPACCGPLLAFSCNFLLRSTQHCSRGVAPPGLQKQGRQARQRRRGPSRASTAAAGQSLPGDAAIPSSSSHAVENTSLLELLRFTLPTLGVWIINPILSLVDTAVVGARSTVELAALGPGTMLCDYNAYIFTFLAVAVTNMLAISFAKRDKRTASAVVSDALAIALLLGVTLGVVMYAAAPALLHRIAGPASAALVEPATSYVRIRCLGLPAALLIFVLQAVFLAGVDPVTPLLAAAVAGFGNLAGDLLLVNVFGLGIAGAAWATAGAQVVTAGMLLRAVYQPIRDNSIVGGWRLDVRWRLPKLRALLLFLSYAGPVCGVLVAKVVTYTFVTTYAAKIGPTASAAHHCVFSVFIFFAVFGDAVSQAAQTFLPRAVGSPAAAWRIGKRMMTTGGVVGAANSVAAGALILTAPWIFTTSGAISVAMATLVPFMSAALLLHTASLASEGLLLAGQDLNFLVVSYIVNMGIAVSGLLYTQRHGMGLRGIWLGVIAFQLVRLIFNWARLNTGRSPLNRTTPLTGVTAIE